VDRSVAFDPSQSLALNSGSDPMQSPLKTQAKSFQAARALTSELLGKGVQLNAAVTDGGTYRGPMIGETDDLVIQQITPKSAVAHQKDLLDSTPQVGQRVSIAYVDSHASVREIRERAKSPGLAR
jgi:hypothetical protein